MVRIGQKRINFELNPQDLLLIFRHRDRSKLRHILGLYLKNDVEKKSYSVEGRGYTIERLVIAPALVLHSFSSMYGKNALKLIVKDV